MRFLLFLFLITSPAFAQGNTAEGFTYNSTNSAFTTWLKGGTSKSVADYERGVCTLAPTGATGFTTVYCVYERIGKTVHVLSSYTYTGVSASANIDISPLPFAAKTGITQALAGGLYVNGDSLNHATTTWRLSGLSGSVALDWDKITYSSGGATNVANTDLLASGNFSLNFWYIID